MKKLIPKSVRVAGVDYKVQEVENVIIEGSTEYGGSCDYASMEIEIRESLPQTRKDEVFVHELLHAMFYEAGYQEHDEDMVNRVGKVLYQVLKDNPNLMNPLANIRQVKLSVDGVGVEDMIKNLSHSALQPLKE